MVIEEYITKDCYGNDECDSIQLSKLVCIAATLLIEQSRIDEEIHNKKLNKQKFYSVFCNL